jgi:hypothetical protein
MKQSADIVEGTAATASLLCLAHCLALPALILVLPVAAGLFVGSEFFHIVMLALVAPLAVVAFWLGYRRHRDVRPGLGGALSLVGLGIATLPGISQEAENAVTIASSLVLVLSHLWNWKLRAHASP